MRLFYLLTFVFFSQFSAQAYTFQKDSILEGSKAQTFLPNSRLVRLYANTPIPAYVQWLDGRAITPDQAFQLLRKWGGWDDAMQLEKIATEQDELGFTHERYQQTMQGIPVLGGVYILHLKQGLVQSMNGLLYAQFNFVAPSYSESLALDNAKQSMHASLFKWEIPAEEAHLKKEQNNPKATYYPITQKIIIPKNLDFYNNTPEFVTCYAFDLYAHEPIDRKKVFIHAQNGDVEYQESLLKHATNSVGKAKTMYSDTQTIITDSTSPVTYRLRETTRGLGVETWNLQKGTNYAAAVDFIDSNNFWYNVNANKDEYAPDAHWGLEKTWDYYWFKHNRNSINNAGFKLLNYVHYSTNYTNAFWDGTRMTYGDGAAPYTPLVAMDIVAHEITHGLTEFTSNLVYSYESGALNESFSDIFGVSVDFYSRPAQANYLMGDGIGGTPFRSMQNPNLYGDPDTYLGTNWYTGTADNGGVHTNSGVQNFWYYLMINGGSGTNDIGNPYVVTGMGLDTAGKIAFRNNTVYLTASSQYADARFYAIQSAADLYGMCTEPVKQTTNAWYAVGVGAKFDTTVTVNFTANPTSNCLVPSTHVFTNTSSVGSYQWYFGDGGTSTLTNPAYIYNTAGIYTVKLVTTCGIKKDSLIKTNYINITPAVPVVFTRTNDTTICEKSSITLKANANLGAPTWLYSGITDTQITVSPKATTIYRFSRNNSCQTFYDSIRVVVNKTPTINTSTAVFPTICSGNIDTVKATGSLRNDVMYQLGTGTSTTATNGNTPYNRTWEGSRTQWIIRASELTALGASAGPIKYLAFNVTTTGSGTNHQKNFTIKMGHTAQTTMGTAWATTTGNMVQVYGPVTVTNPPTGWNTYTFSCPFDWDGTSNIVLDICHDNDINNTCASCFSPNATVQYTTLTYNAVYSNFSDNAQRCGTSGGTTTGYTATRRPNIRFGFYPLASNTAGINWNWTPGNISTANAVVYPSNIPVTSYKVLATTPSTTCSDSSTVNINVAAKPTLVAAADTTICSGNGAFLKATATGGTVTWNPGGLTGTNVLVNPTTTTTYIGYIDNGTCVVHDTMVVTVIPTPTITARTDTTICAGQSVSLTATSNISPITWNPGGLIGSPVIITPTNNTTYIASVNNACGTKTDTVIVTVTPIPTITARPDTTSCSGQSVTLYATSNISPITWNPGGLIGANVIVNPTNTTTYIASVNNSCGSKADTVIINVTPIPTITARPDTGICNGQSVTLYATSNITPITWNPGGLIGANVVVNPTATTTYIASVNNTCGSKTDTVIINVTPIPTLIARNDTTICQGATINLTAVSNISPITWNPGNIVGNSVPVNPTATTSYIARVLNTCAVKYDTVLVTVIPQPTLIARADTTVCSRTSVPFYATTNQSTVTWFFPPSTILNGNGFLRLINDSAQVIASVSNTCNSKSDTVNIYVNRKPTLIARADTSICEGDSVQLTATSNASVTWNPGALFGFSVSVSPVINTAYIASSTNVCGTSLDTVNITVIEKPIVAGMKDTTICIGTPVKLFGYSSLPITWNPGNLANLSIINPTTTTSYIAQVNNACGIGKDTVVVSVVQQPTITATADTNICPNTNIILQAIANAAVTWMPGNINATQININPTSSQNYIATTTNLCGSKSDTVAVTVLSIPNITASADTTVCAGSPVVLQAVSNINQYTWTPGNLSTASINVSPTQSSLYIAQSINKCGTAKDSVQVNVLALPFAQLGADTFVCKGSSIKITAKGNGNYLWNIGGNDSFIVVNPIINSTYGVSVTNSCGQASDFILVTVQEKPTAKASFTKNGNKVSFINQSVGAKKYLWIFGDGNTDTSTEVMHTYSGNASVKPKLIAMNDCGNDTFQMSISLSAIQNIHPVQVNIYPIPATEYVVVESLDQSTIEKVECFNALGQNILFSTTPHQHGLSINTSALAAGIYQLQITIKGAVYQKQIVIE